MKRKITEVLKHTRQLVIRRYDDLTLLMAELAADARAQTLLQRTIDGITPDPDTLPATFFVLVKTEVMGFPQPQYSLQVRLYQGCQTKHIESDDQLYGQSLGLARIVLLVDEEGYVSDFSALNPVPGDITNNDVANTYPHRPTPMNETFKDALLARQLGLTATLFADYQDYAQEMKRDGKTALSYDEWLKLTQPGEAEELKLIEPLMKLHGLLVTKEELAEFQAAADAYIDQLQSKH